MKNKDFFYQQYEKINWENQEKTKINSLVNNIIIDEIILKHKSKEIKLFDIGFGIGFFIKMLYKKLLKHYKIINLSGCEPSEKNYNYLLNKSPLNVKNNVKLDFYKETFQNFKIDKKFDFITAIYVFPHFSQEDLHDIVKKIYNMLEEKGKFVLVVANEEYIKDKLNSKKDLSIENNIINLNGNTYNEVLHYSDIPKIGKVIDYNREENYYLDLFKNHNLRLIQKKNLNDNGFICTIFVFEK